MKNLITIRDLRVRRGTSPVLHVETLEIARGEVLAVVGPNGAGKTTLLMALAHLLGPQEGQMEFLGEPVLAWGNLRHRRKIALVFQNPLLLDMSVFDNVALGLRFRRIPEPVVRARVQSWLHRLRIDGLARRRASQLSGGEGQRVSLARAFVLEPELLLLDEPFLALDPPARAKLVRDLAGILQSGNRTALLVTHNLAEAAKISSRVAVIVGGRLRQVGTARQIMAHPADRHVASFLRSMPR
jgi:tungstate transport system ATP-binding protein